MKYIILLLSIVIFSCSETYVDEPRMLYYRSYPNTRAWIGENEIDLLSLKIIHPLVFINFDVITRQLWVLSFSEDKKFIIFYYITDGNIDVNRYVLIERPSKIYYCEQLYNNKFLYCIDDKNYTIVDIITQERTDFIIDEIDGKSPMGYPQDPLGFSDDIIVFRNGHYSISESKYYFFNDIKYPRYIAAEEKIIGLNYNNQIVFYDLKSKSIDNTNINRKINKYSKYGGDDLYFLKDNKLYFSKDLNGFYRIAVNFFPIGYSKREWYVYNFQDKNLVKLKTPDDMVVLLGNLSPLEDARVTDIILEEMR